jgi:dolichol-phosphate mannosyltransferase
VIASSPETGQIGRILVVIPTFNERENLPLIAGRVRAAVPRADLLVVDDASPDGTGEVADVLVAGDEQIHVLHHGTKAGLGPAYRAGFSWALAGDYDTIVQMDADGSHAPEQLPLLLSALAGADLVLGARWVDGGEVENWPQSRKFLSVGGNAYVRLLLGLPMHDCTGGFRAYRRAVLEGVKLDEVASQGYCFQVDLALRAYQAGFAITEVPITFVERVHGVSKMSRSIVIESLWRVTAWGLISLPRRWRARPVNPASVTVKG